MTARRYFGGLVVGTHAVSEGILSTAQLESGLFRRVLRNVYIERDAAVDHRLRAQAAALLMPTEAAIGGRSAAAWFGAPLAGATDPVVVVVPPDCRWQGPHGVQVHRTGRRPDEVWTDDEGVRLTTVRRTAWDVATLETPTGAVVLLDGMLHDAAVNHGELTEAVLAAEFTRRKGRWGSRKAQFVLPLVDGRSMSPPESRVRMACHLAGLPHPVPQFRVFDDGAWLADVDLAWPDARLVVEYEGAYHFDELQIRRDDARYERLVAAGWRVIRLSSADLGDLEAVVRRIAAALRSALTG